MSLEPLAAAPLVTVDHLVVRFPLRGGRQFIRPVDDVSFTIGSGEVLALVGESGSGKTTIGRALLRILEPSFGRISVAGTDVSHIKGRELTAYRRQAQMIFQDPFASLNPVKTVENHLVFPIRKHQGGNKESVDQLIDDLLERVGLTPVNETRKKFPHELSGGQRQRLAIARALAVQPQFLVADEPISMLDVSIRAGILQLLGQLKRDFHLSFLYVTHDLASARYFGDRIMVLYAGKIMESAPSRDLIRNPLHPYTKLLLAATPGSSTRHRLPEKDNQPPDLSEARVGCPFAPRCLSATTECTNSMPPMTVVAPERSVACYHPDALISVKPLP
ncbi:ABC transporter ATP-binding protein [Sulfobacillus sp. hq2]|uniref:ABC transporter ATP-binding protein n=1 Tax=Sulfobacillus TaxID=28033 RepID=UPI000CD0BA2A|nr:ABC transporter ATP-binding protein [Sulfobacillus sp. hq2]POB11058.1 dipeptide/oligopeptide/nickel ABC transporter ATP-binding protein [Sulfobacillus sp. hq2]